MSQSRPVRRLLAAAVSVPLALTAAPLTGIAEAAVTILAAEHPLPSPRLVGPNAGFTNPAQGVAGFTPLFRFQMSDPSVAVSSVTVGIQATTLNVFRDFDAGNGFSIFADLGGDGEFETACPADSASCFDDAARGPVSTGYSVGTPSAGVVPVTITGRQATTADPPEPLAKGGQHYFVVVRPKAGVNLPDRVFTPILYAGSILAADGSTGPSAAVTPAPVTLDSFPPPAPAVGNFVPVPRAPVSPTQPLEDAYQVSAAERNEPGKMLAFLNSATDISPSSALRHVDGSMAVHPAPSFSTQLTIGDGTGIGATVKVANNNQTSDTVYVRGLDAAGNLSAAATLNTDQADNSPNRGNDVTAPIYTSFNPSFRSTAAGAALTHVNSGTAAALPVLTDVAGVPTGTPGQYNVTTTLGRMESRLIQINGLNEPVGEPTAWKSGLMTAGGGQFAPVITFDVRTAPEGARFMGQSRMFDQFGNVTGVVDTGCSAATPTLCPTLGTVIKDTTIPQILAAIPVAGFTDSTLGNGDKIKLFFSEPLVASQINEMNAGDDCAPTSPVSVLGPCVVFRTEIVDGAPVQGDQVDTYQEVYFGGTAQQLGFNQTTGTHANPAAGTAGTGPGFDWVDGNAGAIITLGPLAAGQRRLIEIGDTITPLAGVLKDPAGNVITAAATLKVGGIVPVSADTSDTATRLGYFNNFPTGQPGDGALDGITITFGAPLNKDTVAAAAGNFRILGSSGDFVPEVVLPTANSATVELRIPSSQVLSSGETPLVSLVGVGPGSLTGLADASGGIIAPFSLLSTDKAAPRLVELETQDLNADGHIDALAALYSEPINHAQMNERAYQVLTYTNIDQGTAAGTRQRAANTFTPTTGSGPSQVIQLSPDNVFDTGVSPVGNSERALTLAEQPHANLPSSLGLQDLAVPPNYSEWSLPFIPDGAAPVAVSALTRDVDSDGKLDAIDLKFSEALASVSTSNGLYEVAGHAVSGSFGVAADTVRVVIDETGEPFAGDTAEKPVIKYLGGVDGGILDGFAGTPAVVKPADDPGITPADGAGPAMVSATLNFEGNTLSAESPTSTKMKAIFSEPVAAVAPANFLVSQPDVDPAAPGDQSFTGGPSAAALATDGLSAELTLEPAFDRLKDSTVQFVAGLEPAADVKDKVTPTPNTRTQTAPVTAFGFPVVGLALAGPAGSAAGFSTSKTFDTGSTGTPNVTAWCLKFANTSIGEADPAAPTAVDDPCFVVAQPVSLTVPIDGRYSVLLAGRDRFGNITQPATGVILVDASAPAISTLPFKNFTTGSTSALRDADLVYVEATATGPGAGSFSATIDYRSISGASTDGARPGTVRSTTGTSRTFRFPFVTASGTTVYPVGTLLRPTNDPGQPFVLEDGPAGTVVRRRLLSAQALSTYRIPSNLVISVPPAVTNGIAQGALKPYRDGSLVRATGTAPVFVITEGRKYQFTSRAQFEGLGYEFADVLSVPAADLAKVTQLDGQPFGVGGLTHAVGTYIRSTTDGATYVVVKDEDGDPRIRRIVSSTALNTLVPITQVINLPETHPSLLLPVDGLRRGLRDGMLVRFANDPRVFAVSRGSMRHINSRAAFELMGFSFRNVVTVRPADFGLTAAGLPVSTRPISFTVTVRDQAGNTAVKTGTVTALGTPSAVPSTGDDAALP